MRVDQSSRARSDQWTLATVTCAPHGRHEFDVLETMAARRRPDTTQADQKVVAALHRFELPLLQNLEPATVARIREDDPAVRDFQVMLREFAQKISASGGSPSFEIEVRQAANDYLEPSINKLAKLMQHAFKKHVAGSLISFATGAVAGFIASGEPRGNDRGWNCGATSCWDTCQGASRFRQRETSTKCCGCARETLIALKRKPELR
jgi:hypothetical protein